MDPGHDCLGAASLMVGCDGLVTGLGNVRIENHVRMFVAAQRGDSETVKECQRRINDLYAVIRACPHKSVAVVKAALDGLA